LGYRISHTWKQDVLKLKTTTISKQTASIAFMDDTTWMAPNQENLDKILSIADEFYKITNTAINKSKSELIINKANIPSTVDIKFEEKIIVVKLATKPMHFLEV